MSEREPISLLEASKDHIHVLEAPEHGHAFCQKRVNIDYSAHCWREVQRPLGLAHRLLAFAAGVNAGSKYISYLKSDNKSESTLSKCQGLPRPDGLP